MSKEKVQEIKITKSNLLKMVALSMADFYLMDEMAGVRDFDLERIEKIVGDRLRITASQFNEWANPKPKTKEKVVCKCGKSMKKVDERKYICECGAEKRFVSIVSDELTNRIDERINKLIENAVGEQK